MGSAIEPGKALRAIVRSLVIAFVPLGFCAYSVTPIKKIYNYKTDAGKGKPSSESFRRIPQHSDFEHMGQLAQLPKAGIRPANHY